MLDIDNHDMKYLRLLMRCCKIPSPSTKYQIRFVSFWHGSWNVKSVITYTTCFIKNKKNCLSGVTMTPSVTPTAMTAAGPGPACQSLSQARRWQ